MMRCTVLASFFFVCLCLLSRQSPFWLQGEPEKDPLRPLEGDWTEVIDDWGKGNVSSVLPEPEFPHNTFGRYRPYRWKITKNTIEWGMDVDRNFPERCFTYTLNPGGQTNAIDLTNVFETQVRRGIYFVNGDYLMICIEDYLTDWSCGSSRPKTFVADRSGNHWIIMILRRGRAYKKNGHYLENGKCFIGPVRELM